MYPDRYWPRFGGAFLSPAVVPEDGMSFPTMPDPIGDREHEQARWHPDRETLQLATAGAANDRVVVRDAIASMREQSQSAKRELPVGKQWLAKISQAFSRFS